MHREWCSDRYTLPPQSKTIIIGNSYLRETIQSYILGNFDKILEIQNRNATDFTTCSDEKMCNTEFAKVYFENGAVVVTVVNHEVNWNMHSGKGLGTILRLVDMHLGDVDAIIMNRGNDVAWARKHPFWEPVNNISYGNQVHLHNICSTAMYLGEMRYNGSFIAASGSYISPDSPFKLCPSLDLTNMSYAHDTLYLSEFAGVRCSEPDCGKKSGHQCIPGPPNDAFQMILYKLARLKTNVQKNNRQRLIPHVPAVIVKDTIN